MHDRSPWKTSLHTEGCTQQSRTTHSVAHVQVTGEPTPAHALSPVFVGLMVVSHSDSGCHRARGFSCFAPKRNRALLDLSGGRLGSQVQMVTRLGARACLVCGGAWVCRECLRDLKFAYREMRAGAGPAEVREDVFMRPLPSSLG